MSHSRPAMEVILLLACLPCHIRRSYTSGRLLGHAESTSFSLLSSLTHLHICTWYIRRAPVILPSNCRPSLRWIWTLSWCIGWCPTLPLIERSNRRIYLTPLRLPSCEIIPCPFNGEDKATTTTTNSISFFLVSQRQSAISPFQPSCLRILILPKLSRRRPFRVLILHQSTRFMTTCLQTSRSGHIYLQWPSYPQKELKLCLKSKHGPISLKSSIISSRESYFIHQTVVVILERNTPRQRQWLRKQTAFNW